MKEIPNSSICQELKLKQLTKYLCLNNLMAIWKNNTHKLKKKFFISFISDHNYLLMNCVHILGTARLLKLWHQIRHCYPTFLLHTHFHQVLHFYHINHQKPSFANIWQHWKECSTSNAQTINTSPSSSWASTDVRYSCVSLKHLTYLTAPLWVYCSAPSHRGAQFKNQ